MRPETLIPSNPGVLNKITFPGGYDLKDLAFFFVLAFFISAVYLAPILIVFENHEEFKLVYQVVSALGVWILGTALLIKRWFGRESAWRVFIHMAGFLFRKKRHVFYTLQEVNPTQQTKAEKTKTKTKKITNEKNSEMV